MAWKRMSGVYHKRMSLKMVWKINKTGIEKEREKKGLTYGEKAWSFKKVHEHVYNKKLSDKG